MSPTACGLCPSGTGDITSLLGKTLAYDSAGRLSQATGVPPCPGGVNCSGTLTTTSRYNGWGQRLLRENDLEQSVFSYGLEGFNLLSQTTRRLATSQQSTTEHIWLPTASGPMPIAAVIDGTHHAVHADHLNTPRRLSDSAGQTRWQWPYSGFGEIAPQSTPAAGQAPISYSLRYPGQIDDGNELFYNWHRFYDPRVGRYTKADPIGLDGGWNRFGYVDGDPVNLLDFDGLQRRPTNRPSPAQQVLLRQQQQRMEQFAREQQARQEKFIRDFRESSTNRHERDLLNDIGNLPLPPNKNSLLPGDWLGINGHPLPLFSPNCRRVLTGYTNTCPSKPIYQILCN